jgi:hypothetical protein
MRICQIFPLDIWRHIFSFDLGSHLNSIKKYSKGLQFYRSELKIVIDNICVGKQFLSKNVYCHDHTFLTRFPNSIHKLHLDVQIEKAHKNDISIFYPNNLVDLALNIHLAQDGIYVERRSFYLENFFEGLPKKLCKLYIELDRDYDTKVNLEPVRKIKYMARRGLWQAKNCVITIKYHGVFTIYSDGLKRQS